MVAAIKRPVVVDAVRDLSDFLSLSQFQSEPKLWYVDAPESAIRSRLEQRQKKGARPMGNETTLPLPSDPYCPPTTIVTGIICAILIYC